MSPVLLAYKLIGNACATALLPPIWFYQALRGRNLERLYQRLGLYPREVKAAFHGSPRIWMHAVSVGEVGVAASIIKALKTEFPQCSLALSTSTAQGMARAQALAGHWATCFFAPIDMDASTRLALRMVKPDILALLETEIWPNLIVTAKHMGARTVLLNGRISVRTIKRYSKIKSLMRHTLSHVDAFSMISAGDAARIQMMGAAVDRIHVNGNAKFDSPDPISDPLSRSWAADLFNLHENTPVFVAGSTRHPEEPIILEAFQSIRRIFPQTLLIIAPRHTERVDQVEHWVREKGMECQRRTRLDGRQRRRTAPVVILDTIGELSAVYSAASFVFCGGSLVDKGGQNLLEPAMWSKPVIHGPSMEDFADARRLLEKAGGSQVVSSAQEIARIALEWLSDPEKAKRVGANARNAILPHRGAAQKHASLLVRMLCGQHDFRASCRLQYI